MSNPAVGSLRCISNYCQSEGNEPDKLYKTIDVEVKGHDAAIINSYEKFVSMAARELGVTIEKISTPPRVIKRYTLLKSAHVHRKHMVQYEMRTLFRSIQIKHVTGSTADTLLEYIQRNLPEGMAMKVTRCAIEAIPQHLQASAKESPRRIQEKH
jgi:small subunit ribosomal protein S10